MILGNEVAEGIRGWRPQSSPIAPTNPLMRAIQDNARPTLIPVLGGQVYLPDEITPQSIGKRGLRMLWSLKSVPTKGMTRSTARERVARKFGKRYSKSDFDSTMSELILLGYVLEYEDMLYRSEKGNAFLLDLYRRHRATLSVKTGEKMDFGAFNFLKETTFPNTYLH